MNFFIGCSNWVVAIFFNFREVLDLRVLYTIYFVSTTPFKILKGFQWVGKKIKMCRCACYKQNVVSPIDLLIDYLLFYVRLKNVSLIWRHQHCRWKTAKFRPMVSTQGLWAGMDLYHATPAVIRGLSFFFSFLFCFVLFFLAFFFFESHWKDHPIQSPLMTHGCGGSILTWILIGQLWSLCKMHVLCNSSYTHEKI